MTVISAVINISIKTFQKIKALNTCCALLSWSLMLDSVVNSPDRMDCSHETQIQCLFGMKFPLWISRVKRCLLICGLIWSRWLYQEENVYISVHSRLNCLKLLKWPVLMWNPHLDPRLQLLHQSADFPSKSESFRVMLIEERSVICHHYTPLGAGASHSFVCKASFWWATEDLFYELPTVAVLHLTHSGRQDIQSMSSCEDWHSLFPSLFSSNFRYLYDVWVQLHRYFLCAYLKSVIQIRLSFY